MKCYCFLKSTFNLGLHMSCDILVSSLLMPRLRWGQASFTLHLRFRSGRYFGFLGSFRVMPVSTGFDSLNIVESSTSLVSRESLIILNEPVQSCLLLATQFAYVIEI